MKRKQVLLALVVLGLTSFGASAWAADNADNNVVSANLDELIITAAKLPQKGFDAQADVTVINRQQIEDRHYADLGEALKSIPGVNLQNYGTTGENYSANRLYINGSNKIVILVDGVRLNRNGGNSNVFSPSEFSNMENIERIEVLKGSATTLYGADAAGGVINIITKAEKKNGMTTTIDIARGSFDHNDQKISNYGYKDGFYWNLTAQHNSYGNYRDGDGKTIIQDINSKSFEAILGAKINDKNEVKFLYNRYLSDYKRPDFGGYANKAIKDGDKSNARLSLVWRSDISDNVTNTLSVYKNMSVVHDGTNKPASIYLIDIATRGITDEIIYTGEKHKIVGGVDIYQDIVNKYGYGGAYYGGIKITNRALYIQDVFAFAPNWTITPGLRYTSNSYFGTNTSKSLALGYNNGTTNVYGSYNEFFVAPNQSEMFGKYGTPTLKPSEGKTLQLGVKHRFDDTLSGNFTIYKTKASNLVGYDYATSKYQNINDVKITGWNVGLEKQLNEHLSLSTTYTHTHMPATSPTKNPNNDGYIPKGTLDVSLTYTQDKFNASLVGRGIFDRPGTKANEAKVPDSLKSFWLFDVALNYKPMDDMTVYMKVNNVFDKLYTDHLYQALSNTNNWYPGPGRSVEVGVTYKF